MSGQDGMLRAITVALNCLFFEFSPLNDVNALNNSDTYTCRPLLTV